MLKKIFQALSGKKNTPKKEGNTAVPKTEKEQVEKIKEVTETPVIEDLNKYEKYITAKDHYFWIRDYKGELETLPDAIFDGFEYVTALSIWAKNLTSLPKALKRFKNLKSITIHLNKIKELPVFILNNPDLEYLNFTMSKLRLNEHLPELKKLKKLDKMAICGMYGKKWPTHLKELTQLRELTISATPKKYNHLEMIRELGQMDFLDLLNIHFKLDMDLIGEEIVALDKITNLRIGPNPYQHNNNMVWGLFKNASFGPDYRADQIGFDEFRAILAKHNFDNDKRKLLFGIYTNNMSLLKDKLVNLILENHQQQKPIDLFFEYKPKRNFTSQLKNLTKNTGLQILKDSKKGCIHIINEELALEYIAELMAAEKTICTEDHVKDWITKVEKPWLLQEENEDSNQQIFRLLASNQIENYLVAFQIIAGGGANGELISVIAAIMLSHPDKKVAREAEKLFAKVGPSSALSTIKVSRIFLRRSGDSSKRIARLFKMSPGIPELPFRLMHHIIAGENPVIKDVQLGTLDLKKQTFNEPFPACAKYFEKIEKLDLSYCKGLDTQSLFKHLPEMKELRKLNLAGCHLNIPEKINELTNLNVLDISSNQLENPKSLGALKSLYSLNIEGCKPNTCEFLGELKLLQTLHIGRNGLKEIPIEVFEQFSLRYLFLNNNKLGKMDARLIVLPNLSHLDYSSNGLTEINYTVFTHPSLTKLSLRTNKIKEVSIKKIKEFLNRRGRLLLNELKINNNQLTEFNVPIELFSQLHTLDISKNKISKLDKGIFQFTSIKYLYASNNNISAIPDSISGLHLKKLDLAKNNIQEMTKALSEAIIENCNLSYNNIETKPKLFDRKHEYDFSRLYWNYRGNPIDPRHRG